MILIYMYLIGFLQIAVSGDRAPEILNIAARNGIPIRFCRWEKGKIIGYITVPGFKSLRRIKGKNEVHIEILKKRGLPFLLKRYRHRYGIIAGSLIFFGFLKLMSCFIWNIDVIGADKNEGNLIIKKCAEIGVEVGTPKNNINPTVMSQKLLLNNGELAWASLNIEGCNLTVNITKAKSKDSDSSPSNLKADSDGIIERIDVTSGNAVVKVGQTVAKGDVLVSGIIEKADGTTFVPSRGSVTAKSDITFTSSKNLVCYEEKNAGKKFSVYKLKIFGGEIPLSLRNISKCKKISNNNKKLKINGKTLPISLISSEYVQVERKKTVYTQTQAKKILETDINKKLNEFNAESAVLISQEFKISGDKAILEKRYAVTRNIAEKDEIIINVGN